MKKTILCLLLFTISTLGLITSATAAPTITKVHGGYGVTATITDADGLDWHITILKLGKTPVKIEGTISGDNATIRTPRFPPVIGMGLVGIIVTIHRPFLPDIIEVRAAFMLGPFVLLIH